MTTMTLKDLAEEMKSIDFGMLTTKTEDGGLASRPMSNNQEVEYDGDSFFFSFDDTRTISDIGRDANVGLTFTGSTVASVANVMGKPPLFIAIEGKAELIRDKAVFETHWDDSMKRWFEQGVDTPGLILIKVAADRVHYWDGEEEREIKL